MSHPLVRRRRDRRRRASLGVLLDDVYIKVQPWPRAGRPVKRDLETWLVTDDWADQVPVTDAEVGVFEAWLGDIFDQLLGSQ
jgi:hypothetical protein